MYRHIIRVLLTVVCLTLLASAAIADGEVDNPRPLALNTPMQLDIPEYESVWLSYKPDKSGSYHFTSDIDPEPYCELYEGDVDNWIDDWYGSLTYDLTEGITYYFVVNAEEDSQGTVKLTRDTLSVTAVGERDLEVEYGAQVTLEVEAYSDTGNEITYLWTDEDENPLKGNNTGRQYVIESFTSSETSCYCQVYDGVSRKTVEFYVWFDNHLQAHAEYDTLTVYEDEPAVLKIIGSCDQGTLSYEWFYVSGYESEYDEDTDEEIAVPILKYLEEDGNEITVTASDVPQQMSRMYGCNVKDSFGGFTNVFIQVRNDNGLTADPKGSGIISVPLHGETVLEVEVSVGRGGVTYEWFTEDLDANEYPIEGASTEKLVLSDVTGPGEYNCRVSDEYGNTALAIFEVKIDNKLQMEPIGATYYCVSRGQDVTLKTQASCENGECSIKWYEWSDDEGDYIVIGTGPSLTLQNLQSSRLLSCEVDDDYGSHVEIEYRVVVNSYLLPSTPINLTLKYGKTAQLGVKISKGSGISSSDITFNWAYEEEGDDEEGAYWVWVDTDGNQPTFTTDKLTKATRFMCRAAWYDEEEDEDFYEEVYFHINVKEPDYSDYSHNLKMFINTFGGIPSNPTEGNYYYNVDGDNTRIHRYNVFRYVVIENRDEMKKKLNGEPVWSIKRLSGTVSLEIANSQFGESNIAYQLCVRGTPENEETAKYLVRCIWGTEMWEQEFTIHFVDLTDNQPEAVEFLGAGDHWVETVGQLFTMEENFGFRDHWTPAAGQTIIVSYGSRVYPNPIYDVIKSKSASDGSWKYFANTPGIYNFHAVITFGNVEIWHPVTLYVLQKNGLLADGNTLNLPSGLKKIEPNAFEKTAEEIVVIPDGCTEIGSEAFAYSANLKQVVLPASVTGIDPTAFDECEEVVAIVSADASADAAADAAEAAGLIVLRK